MWKFHENRSRRFREILCTKSVRQRIIIIGKKKPNKNNKVFRWKRKTLIMWQIFQKIFLSSITALISTILCTKHPWDLSLFKWRPRPFPRGENKEIVKIHWKKFCLFLPQNYQANYNQTWYTVKAFSDEWNSSLFNWRATPFSKRGK